MEAEIAHRLLQFLLSGPFLTFAGIILAAIVGYFSYLAQQSKRDAIIADQKLFIASLELLPFNSRAIEFIQERDFLRRFYTIEFRPLERFHEFLSLPDKTFHNRTLENKRKKLTDSLDRFIKKLNSTLKSCDIPNLYTFLEDDEQDDFTDESPETQASISALESLANLAYVAYSDYEKTGRNVLKL